MTRRTRVMVFIGAWVVVLLAAYPVLHWSGPNPWALVAFLAGAIVLSSVIVELKGRLSLSQAAADWFPRKSLVIPVLALLGLGGLFAIATLLEVALKLSPLVQYLLVLLPSWLLATAFAYVVLVPRAAWRMVRDPGVRTTANLLAIAFAGLFMVVVLSNSLVWFYVDRR